MRRSLDVLPVARYIVTIVCVALFGAATSAPASATPALSMDVATGEVLYQQDATQPWFPASTTKLMTVYVALSAVRDHKIAMDTPLVYSARARTMPPSKMGFAPGTQITLENALRMLMVKSANDVAITVAEGVSGSVEAFADDMNRAAAHLGLHESHFANPNGLPNPDHYSSARDMALIARALYLQFPQEAPLFDIGAMAFGSAVIPNHNNLLGRYPGADGMKTGFTCAAGFNVVASAFRDGRRVLVVIMGAPSVATRTAKAVALFDRAFANIDRPSESIVALRSTGGGPPDMHNAVCRNRGPLIARFNSEVAELDAPLTQQSGGVGFLSPERALLFNTPNTDGSVPWATRIASMPRPVFEPVAVHIGADPGYQGPVAEARAPHSPIGTESAPSAVEAYAPAGPVQGVGITPLAVDPSALPLKGRHVRAARSRHGRSRALKAAAEAPTAKVVAGAEGDEGAPAKPPSVAKKPSAKKTRSASTKKHVVKEKHATQEKPAADNTKAVAEEQKAVDEGKKTIAEEKVAKATPGRSGKSAAKSRAAKSKSTASGTKAAAKKTTSAAQE